MSRHLWLDPTFGASGDMLLGALVGLGAPLDEITSGLQGLNVDGWSITTETTTRGGISATRAIVRAAVGHHHRSWSSIDQLLAEADLPPTARDGARATFRLLGEIEARQHAVDIDEVHFHEVGAVDAIVDIVGVWVARSLLNIASVSVGPVGLGHGTVKAAHGVLPLPAPATLALLDGAPVRSLDVQLETCTPTGAALLRSLGAWGAIPDGVIAASARGAGGRNPDTHPNVVTAILVETTDSPDQPVTAQPAVVLSTNVDDVTPEVLGHVINKLLAAGADDAWIVPIQMKKNRPAHELSVLTSASRAEALRELISRETGTLGIRATDTTKFPLDRTMSSIEVRGAVVAVKVGPFGAKPEHDDLVALSEQTGVPVRVLAEEARTAWLSDSRNDSEANQPPH
ncbi:MAG: hypothetical protein ACI8TP_002699 [Acidimicrobiales bacterium]